MMRNRAYTLVEMLVVITVLGIAAALVIPSMSSAGSLRVQGALRMIVADLTVAQSDAIAFQRQRAVVFDFNTTPGRYVCAEVNGTTVDTTTGIIFDRDFSGEQFGFSSIVDDNLTNKTVFFDEMGGPVDGAGSSTPAASQYIEITGSGQTYRINIEAYTGRITVKRM